MIETILQKAADAIALNVAPVSKSGGAVQTVLLRDGKRVRSVPAVPAAVDATSQVDGYIDMLPSDSESAVAFWQVLSTSIDNRMGGANKYRVHMIARCRLVVWTNKKRLSPPDTQAVLGECVRQVLAANLTEDWIQNINVALDTFEKRDKAIFSDYGLDEVETQYLTEPYDFASATFSIQYTALLTCLPEVSAVEISC